jgi:hypothetical protein
LKAASTAAEGCGCASASMIGAALTVRTGR